MNITSYFALAAVKQASLFDGPLFDPFSLFEGCVAAPEAHVSGRDVLYALIVAPVVIVRDKRVVQRAQNPKLSRRLASQ